MRAVVESKDFGRFLDVYLFAETSYGDRIVVFKGPDDGGNHVMEMVDVPEGTRPRPSFQLDHEWVGPLVEALTDHTPTKIDQTILDTLEIERTRVDKLIDHVIAIG